MLYIKKEILSGENMDIEEYEELFGSMAREREYREQLEWEGLNNIVSYATKKDEHKVKKLKIPKRCKVCFNCKYCNGNWYNYDHVDYHCLKFRYSVDEYDRCECWKWNKGQLVDPKTDTVINMCIIYEE